MKLNNKRFALLLMLLGSCNATSNGLQKTNNYVTTHQIDTIAYWNIVNPIMFIDTLTKYPKDIFSIGVYPTTNWYDAKYIKLLETKLKDTTICGMVESVYISKSPKYIQTTIKQQVAYMIEGIKLKKYPSTLSSMR